jgi:hypothetical protein
VTKGFKHHLSHDIEGRATFPRRSVPAWMNSGYENGGPLIEQGRQIIKRSNCTNLKNGCFFQAAYCFFSVSLKTLKCWRLAYRLKAVAEIYLFRPPRVVSISPLARRIPLAVSTNPILGTKIGRHC